MEKSAILKHDIEVTERFFGSFWGHPGSLRALYALIIVSIPTLFVAFFWPPPTGVAAVLLAMTAIAMTAWPRMPNTVRTLAVVSIILMLGVEVRAIYRDDAKRTADFDALIDKTNAIIANDSNATNEIIASANSQFSQAEQNISGVSGLAQQTLRSSNANLGAMEGSGSFPYVLAQVIHLKDPHSPVVFTLKGWGVNQSTGVSVHINDFPTTYTNSFNNVGTVSGETMGIQMFGFQATALPSNGERRFIITIDAQNGAFYEELLLRNNNNEKVDTKFFVKRMTSGRATKSLAAMDWWDGTTPLKIKVNRAALSKH